MQITLSVKKASMDLRKLNAAAEKAKARATKKQLAFIRTRARTKILRKRKGPSDPGRPPHTHTSGKSYASLKNIRFDYNAGTESGIVGPVKLNQVNLTNEGSQPVPNILEKGGTVGIREVEVRIPAKLMRKRPTNYTIEKGHIVFWKRRDLRRNARPGEKRRVRRARYQPRPFMIRALEAEIQAGTIMSPWGGAIS